MKVIDIKLLKMLRIIVYQYLF